MSVLCSSGCRCSDGIRCLMGGGLFLRRYHQASVIHALIILSSRSVSQVLQCHAQATVRGLLHHHLPTCAALILSYSDLNLPTSSFLLFQHSPLRHSDPFLYNTLVRSHTKSGRHSEAFAAYNAMARSGLRPDCRTFPYLLKACADARCAPKGREVHGSVLKMGFAPDVFAGNTLLAFYGACGSVDDAVRVFDEMLHRDVVSWNSMISVFSDNGLGSEAAQCFVDLRRNGLAVDPVSVISALSACEVEVVGELIHGFAIRSGMDPEATVGNSLVDFYAKCGDPVAALREFYQIREKTDVSWNSVISGLAHNSLFQDSLSMFRAMLADKMEITSDTLSVLLPVLVGLGHSKLGREVHAYSIRTGMVTDVFVANSLMDMYAKSGVVKEASEVFKGIKRKNAVSWNVMIANCAQNKAELGAITLLREMQINGEHSNAVTFINVLPACSRISALKSGKEIHAKAIHSGSCFDLFVSNALLDMYVKCGCMNLAERVFEISERDEVSYNSLIIGYSQGYNCSKALDLFLEMGLIGLTYDSVSFIGVLSACANMSAIKQGKEIHAFLVRRLFHDHLFLANTLLDFYVRNGYLDVAKMVFDQIPNKDVASWNGMISGFAMQGELDTAFELFDSMKDAMVEYDSVSFLTVLSACSHNGLVERGRRYFQEMLSLKIQPTQMHYACMVDLLGRAGLMYEAVQFINGMPFEPNSSVWGALLGACKMHGNLEFGRLAAEHLFVLKPEHSGYYILLANMCAEAGRWSEAIEIRKRMKEKGVKKNPGCSWVEAGNKVHTFVLGEKTERFVAGAT